ncbi:hypothetical protein EGT49_11515 [Companilactobacillus suantsaicola]|uniref:Competence protein ComGF n=1 Tax=Companilactobacillus suantsaicola TaxID=2487723 RepID=A0A4Z0JGH5_9LACO|nr:ComGF family competence protein [Companilactobacillus suantsaicola]TGD21293.1 hypothetical protein EGT49_11515 [Companilactobacillus suantsaicola]
MFIKSKNNRSGFVLYEAIVALLVAILTLGVLQQALQLMKTIQNTTFNDQLRWHITQDKIQKTLDDAYEIREVGKNKIVYTEKELREGYHHGFVFEVYQSGFENYMLRKTTATVGGHEPILTGQKEINIEKISNLVIITTVNKAGEKSEMILTLNDKK